MSGRLILRWLAAFIGASAFIALVQTVYIEHLMGNLAVATVRILFGSDQPFNAWLDSTNLV